MDIIEEYIVEEISPETPHIQYIPKEIDEWIVVVHKIEDWEEIHNYIINENEIDGIPNRKINCPNEQPFSLRSAVYEMSLKESQILGAHPKVERVELNPDKYPQPNSLCILRHKKKVAFHKPVITYAKDQETSEHFNGVRSNWSHLFVTNPSGSEFRGVGIGTTSRHDADISCSLTGKGVDAVIIDSGVSYLHPEFLDKRGRTRVKDVILDGPYKVDKSYFEDRNLTYTKIVDGKNCGVGIATTAAQEWWSDSSKRSPQYVSLGTVTINSNYDLEHVSTKTTNGDGDQIINGHGTACASQIAGKSFGLAYEANIWNIRLAVGGGGGYLSGSTTLNACAIWHNAKKIESRNRGRSPNPTIINNSWGRTATCGNTQLSTYSHNYRGTSLQYNGNGTDNLVQDNAGACRNTKTFTWIREDGSEYLTTPTGGTGQYSPVDSGASESSAAENAIAAGCIVVAAAQNHNQKISDVNDLDYNNWYLTSSTYINRVGGVQKGHSNADRREEGTIRVGALDCALEPAHGSQGSAPYSIRKVCYSNNGPMINVWAPGEMTMAAGYTTSYEEFAREDDSNFYDSNFNGTSAACPNTVSVLCLYLQSARLADQRKVRHWLDTRGSIPYPISDPYPDPQEDGYWSKSFNSTYDSSVANGGVILDSLNVRGNGNLRGAPKKVLHNPFASNDRPKISGVLFDGLSFEIRDDSET